MEKEEVERGERAKGKGKEGLRYLKERHKVKRSS
jgi:hypothetical protein